MGEVVSILSKTPHLAGEAICLACRYKWQAVCPVGYVTDFACPKCGLMKGCYNYNCAPETYWQCNCGCNHFFVSGTGSTLCAHCGLAQNFPW